MPKMTKLLYASLILFSLIWIESCTISNAQNAVFDRESIDAKVKALMKTMTLEDKVGEMTQLAIDMVSVGTPYSLTEPHQLDEEKLKKVLVDLKVGSLLNVGGHTYTQDHWHEILTRIQKKATEEKSTKIPVLYGIDAIHGVNYTVGGTLFPQQIGLAATWNPDLIEEMGKIVAYETRASGIPWTFSPVMDLGRDPRWSRFWETFGEDVLLSSKLGEAMIRGYQGAGVHDKFQVAACLKHFVGYGFPITGKDRTQAWIPERQLQEYFVPTFRAAIEAGAKTVMINSGEMNGIPVHSNPKILKDLLRDDLGFEGVAVSDWEDIVLLITRHRIAKDYKEAIEIAINAGIDMSMVPTDTEFPVLLVELVKEGKVSMERIDEAVSRILTLKFELGLFESPIYPKADYPKFSSEEFALQSKKTALESVTLLKNETNTLPLSKTSKILVTGPTANSLNCLNGGWTHTWQGVDEQYNTKGKQTILRALETEIGKSNVTYIEGTTFNKDINTADAVAAAANADAIIVCLGETPYTEKVGDMDDLNLPVVQIELVKAVAASGKPVIVVLAEGRPRIFRQAEKLSQAVLMAYLPGDEGGLAIADILFGDYNPNGKLPFTYPRFSNSLLTYDHKGTDQIKQDFTFEAFNPQYEFGHGMSYTSFTYEDLKLSDKVLNEDGNLEISVKVTNSGKRDGQEVVQLYVTDEVARITPSVKRLRGFEKISLKAGESKVVKFDVAAKDLAYVGMKNDWVTEEGRFTIQIKNLKDSFVYTVEKN